MNFSDMTTLLALFLRIISSILLLIFCIPLQIKEAKVNNGLKILRYQLLAFGIILFITNCISMIFLTERFFDNVQDPFSASLLQIINSVAFLLIAIIGHLMYHSQYTEENKKLHEDKFKHRQ